VIPFPKLLFVNSHCVNSLPRAYRPAVEASPWYSTGDGIAFYAVDPRRLSESPWSVDGRLAAVIAADGMCEVRPSLDSLRGGTVGDGTLDVRDLRTRGVQVAHLRLGPVIETCDLIETWFGSAS
jgi:hypothetical protein